MKEKSNIQQKIRKSDSHNDYHDHSEKHMQEIELNNSIPWTMERYNNLFRNINDAMTINDLKGNILDVNRQCLDLFGYSRDEMLKLNITDLHPPDVLREVGDNNEKFTRDGFIFLETKFMKKNGDIFTGEVRATRFKIEGHEIIQGLIRDISDKIIAEKRLKESEKRFRTLFEQSIDAIIIHEKGKIKQVNASACKMFGYSKDQLQSMTIMDLLDETERENAKKKINRPERSIQFESRWKRSDGSFIDVEISSVTMDFRTRLTQVVCRDVTKRKRAEERLRSSEELYRTLVENINLLIFLIDSDYNIIMANTYAGKVLNKHPSELVGEKCYKVHEDRDTICSDCPGKGALASGKPVVVERYEEDITGNRLFLRFQAFPLIGEDGRQYGFIEVVDDITHVKKTEDALREAINAAEAANKAKSEFLANMSHEIRTPLNGVMGVLNLLLSTDVDKEQLDLIETGKRSSDSLLTVINDILDFSKIEAGELDLEILDFNLRNAIEEVVELPAMMANEKGLEFIYEIHHEVPSLLIGDPGRLRQILLNLTSNATKFTKTGEIVIRISLESEIKTHAKIRFEVEDTGIGIPADKVETIFESFAQTDSSTTRLYGGTGLGLSISKRLAELMGGEIGVTSELGKGSKFWFTALFEKQPYPDEGISVPLENLRGKRLLLVDDNRTNLEILSGYIESWGCYCDIADSGATALSLMNAVGKVNAPFDAVIIDMRMPNMDGAELGKRIKSDPKFRNTIMIMLTSQGLRGDASRMKEIGFAAYLTKPIRRSLLYDCLVAVLGNKPKNHFTDTSQIITKRSIHDERRSKISILIVEDNIINQKLILRMIENLGFQADTAANGKEALKALESFKYDLTLMDVQMPEMDGFEASKIIRDPQSKVIDHNIPIIAMTALAMKGDRERCIGAGMNDYVSKPIEPQALVEAIERNIPSFSKKDADIPLSLNS